MMDSKVPAFDKAGIKSTDMLTQGSSGIVFQKRVGKSSEMTSQRKVRDLLNARGGAPAQGMI